MVAKIQNFLDSIGPELTQKIARTSSVVSYSDGQLIHSRGAQKPGLSIVKSGSVNVGILGLDGKFIPIAVLGNGECFGEFTLFADLPRTHDILASGPTVLYQLSNRQFDRLSTDSPEIIRALLKITLMRNHTLLGMLDAIRRLPLLERTASVLFSMLMTSSSRDSVKCTQDQLAFNLGVSRVSIGKVLRSLEQLTLIKLGYGEIHFPNTIIFKQWVRDNCDLTPLD